MDIVKLVFSPTGGTQKIADTLGEALAKELDGSMSQIDLSDPFLDENDQAVSADALALIAMPCFGGRAPEVAIKRLERVKSNGAKCVVVNVYGNRDFDDALLEMEDAALANGFEVVAAIVAIAEHSIMHQFATGRPNAQDLAALSGFAQQIAERIKSGEKLHTPCVPGNKPYKKPGAVPLVPKVSHKCTACGTCAKTCPVTAINTVDYAADKDVCIACMRCIKVCPEQARSISSVMMKTASMAIKKAASIHKDCELYF